MSDAAAEKVGPGTVVRNSRAAYTISDVPRFPLGEGSYAIVYAADDGAGNVVALKLARDEPEPSDQQERAKWQRCQHEIDELVTINADLKHPNLPEYIDSGTYNERPFLVMELFDGYTICGYHAQFHKELPTNLERERALARCMIVPLP